MSAAGSAPATRAQLVVIAGPPCSGKSLLADALHELTPGLATLDVDRVREQLLPDSESTQSARRIAYEAMHREAEQLLRAGRDVVVSATYGPMIHRAGIARLVTRASARLCLIQCRIEPDVAVARWRQRGKHPADDLTVWSVRRLAADYPYSGVGWLLDTGGMAAAAVTETAKAALASGTEHDAEAWATEFAASDNADEPPGRHSDEALTRRSHARALNTLLWHAATVAGLVALALIGVAAFASGEKNAASDASVWLTAATLGALVFGVLDFLARPALVRAMTVRRTGSTPRYGPAQTVERSNLELWRDYHDRLSPSEDSRMPLLGVPIYFVIVPTHGVAFQVRFRDVSDSGMALPHEMLARWAADEWGFDWHGYRRWQQARVRDRAAHGGFAPAIRATSLGRDSGAVNLHGVPVDYSDYLLTEQAVGLEIPGQLPYMRYFFEGGRWLDEMAADLCVSASGERYAMMVSVSSLVVTRDGYLILQRRSAHVQAAGGGVGVSAAGNAEWADVRRGDSATALERACRREIFEELGIRDAELEPLLDPPPSDLPAGRAPFIAAAYNLRYGRDLNFYAAYRTTLDRETVSDRVNRPATIPDRLRRTRRDRWEVAHLKFVALEEVRDRGRETGYLRAIAESGRHVQGAIYAVATVLGPTASGMSSGRAQS